jgi:hypothetical protein
MNEKEFLVWFKKYLSDKSSLTERQMNNLKLKLKDVKIESNDEFGVALDLLAEALDNFNKEVSKVNNKNNLPTDGILSKKFKSVKEKFNKEVSKVNNRTVNKNIFWKTNN